MKQFKDPIYGYIDISEDMVSKIIDTPEFQRLRYIKQTSYLPLYSAALHNRFVHSLGVYFLGVKAYNAILKNSKDLITKYSVNPSIEKVFKLACLLHDVGHAPFSHSGEKFYDSNEIYDRLKKEVGESSFSADMEYYHKSVKPAAPHEIMSAIVALHRFNKSFEYFEDAEMRSFFARCITGYKYRGLENNTIYSIYNSFISLLNSSTIDVDRLDYLIRDAFVIGYNSISIDYNRLLGSLQLVEVQQKTSGNTMIQLAYKKSALSVIENVIYAHDSEKKWIQNHPVIQYEIFLIQQIIQSVRLNYKKRTDLELFSLESLLPTESFNKENKYYNEAKSAIEQIINEFGESPETSQSISELLNTLKEHIERLYLPIEISSLCDDDIIYLAKQNNLKFCNELFNRNARRHPIWKSESEYKVCVDNYVGDTTNSDLQAQIETLSKFQNEESPSHCLDEAAIEHCEKFLEDIKKGDLSEQDKQIMNNRYELLLKWLKGFKRIAESQNLEKFSFVIIAASKFESSFKKRDLAKIPVYFPESKETYHLEDLISLFSIKEENRHKFFYIYYTRTNDEKIDALKAGREIAKIALE